MILDGQSPAAITAAAQALQAGRLVGLPTETVYGLAADATQDAAVAQVFSTKGRPGDHPMIVHVADLQDAERFAKNIPAFAQRLLQAHWPGPLTVIVPRAPGVAAAAAGGQDSIGLRCPSHPVALALLNACRAIGVPGLAAPSANRFGRVSPTTAAHVQAEFGDALLILDGGPCEVGIESTIVDCTRGVPVLLRPGGLSRAQIESACGLALHSPETLVQPDPRASGTLLAHYAPRAPVRLMDAPALQTALDVLGPKASGIGVWCRSRLRTSSQQLVLRRMPEDADTAARQLFAMLRHFDDQGCRLIWIETPPDTPAWEAVSDRLQRAAATEGAV